MYDFSPFVCIPLSLLRDAVWPDAWSTLENVLGTLDEHVSTLFEHVSALFLGLIVYTCHET